MAGRGLRRCRFFPGVPTLVEAGYKDMVIDEAIGLLVPPKTPPSIIQNLHDAMTKALATPEALTALNTLGMEATPSTGAEFSAKLKAEHELWGRFVRQIGFKQDS